MYARSLQGRLLDHRASDAVNYFRQSIAPALRQQTGFLNGRLLIGRHSTDCQLITVWEFEEDCEQADANGFLQTLLGQFGQYFVEPVRSGVYEVSVLVNSG